MSIFLYSKSLPQIHLNKISPFIIDFLSGACSIAISKTIVSPFEIVKTRIQSNEELMKQNLITTPYKGISDCLYKTIKNEGILSLWKGNLSNILFHFPSQSLNFAIKSSIKEILPYKSNNLLYNFSMGSIAGMTSMLFFHPLEYIRTKYVIDIKNKNTNIIQIIKKIKQKKKIYDGLLPSIVCMGIYRGVYFGLYDTFKGRFKYNISKLIFGWGVTIFSGAVAYPFDTIRKRIMAASGTDGEYNNSIDCFVYIVNKNGWKYLYKGLWANHLRSLAGAFALIIYDQIKGKIHIILSDKNSKEKSRKNHKGNKVDKGQNGSGLFKGLCYLKEKCKL